MEATLELDLLTPIDWRVLRAARLHALRDSPHAFTSSYAHEWRWGELEWRRAFDTATWVVARKAELAIGLARSVGEPEQPAARNVEAAWVAPTHRRRGVFRALLHALAQTERRAGVTDLLLWVLEDNHDARRAYEALGFEPTGERQFLSAFGRFERRLRLSIRRLSDSVSADRHFGVHHSSAELGQYPSLQLQDIHSLVGAADIVDAVREPLPVVDVALPGVEEVYAKVRWNGA
jgi:GNAT superfamily N-acetyltransferase